MTGTFIGDLKTKKEMSSSLGSFLANLDLALMDFENPILHSRKCEWDIQQLPLNRKYIKDIPDIPKQNLVRYFFMQFEQYVTPILPELRMSYIHSDANEWNILIRENEVNALIDFGDMVYTYTAVEPAVAIAYAVLGRKNSIKIAGEIFLNSHRQCLDFNPNLLTRSRHSSCGSASCDRDLACPVLSRLPSSQPCSRSTSR